MLLRMSATALIVVVSSAPLLSAEPEFDAAGLRRISERMTEFIHRGQISGAVTLVATPDKVVHLAAVGRTGPATDQAMQPDSLFRIASMTKTVTATALMQLVEQGKLNVDDPVEKYIPSFTGQKLKDGTPARPVTIRDVLTHTAGLAQPGGKETEGLSLEQIVDLIGRKPLEFPPGSKWQYSSGLTVAGRLIEIASGESYAGYLKRHIFDPLEMNDTTFLLSPDQAQRLAVTCKPGEQPGTLAAVEIPDPTVERTPNPSGGLYSTAADMARFYQAILNGGKLGDVRLLPAARVQQMTQFLTPGLVTGFTPGNGWGLGWCVLEKPQGVTRHLMPGTYGHGGAWGTQAWVDPQRKLIFILMIQRSGFGNSDASDVRDAFTEAALSAYRGVETPTAKFAEFHGYSRAVELTLGQPRARAVLCPQAGGRVLEYYVDGRRALFLDEEDRPRTDGQGGSISAGRFDFGPELTVPAHPEIWSGTWTAEITGPHSARLVSPHSPKAGVQVLRDFELHPPTLTGASRLSCRQTLVNVSDQPREYCHWGRSFSPGGGICLIPLQGTSRFPAKYAMYEDSAIINVRNTDEKIRERDGFLEILAPPRKPKLGFDSTAGWLAYLRPDNTLFVKRFPVDPDRVYNEAAGLTLSVWYPAGPRIELEPIGPREKLQPGDAASFTEDWWLLEHPFPAAGENIDLKRLREQVERQTAPAR